MAERLVLYLFKQDKEKIKQFAKELESLSSEIGFCGKCFHIAENGICRICDNPKRDQSIICVVEDPLDVISIERTKNYTGLYHVLGGTLSVMSAEEVKKLKINELIGRITENKNLKEIIIATNPTTDGETTALYLARFLKKYDIKITRLARGMSTGGDIEYADEITLSSAIEGRKKI